VIVVTALLAALSQGSPDRWLVALASAGFSIASSLQAPAVSALVPRLVSSEALPAANGWVSAAGSVAELLGPVVGGALLGSVGIGVVLGLDLASYLLSVGLLLLRWQQLGGTGSSVFEGTALQHVAAGMRELLSRRELLQFVLLGTAFNFLYSMNGVVAQPYVLGFAGEGTLGALYAAFAVGMLLGAAAVGRVFAGSAMSGMVWMLALLGATVAISGLAPSVPVVAGCWFASGVGLAMLGSLSTTVLQRSTPPERHGRLFAIVQISAWCAIPLAQILAGVLSDHLFGSLGQLVVLLGLALVGLALVASRMPSLWKLEQGRTA
jgi:DHA3 family macrolide efflux protein-like MFS transporter